MALLPYSLCSSRFVVDWCSNSFQHHPSFVWHPCLGRHTHSLSRLQSEVTGLPGSLDPSVSKIYLIKPMNGEAPAPNSGVIYSVQTRTSTFLHINTYLSRYLGSCCSSIGSEAKHRGASLEHLTSPLQTRLFITYQHLASASVLGSFAPPSDKLPSKQSPAVQETE